MNINLSDFCYFLIQGIVIGILVTILIIDKNKVTELQNEINVHQTTIDSLRVMVTEKDEGWAKCANNALKYEIDWDEY